MQWQNFLCAWSLFPIENFLIFRFEFSTRMFLETYSMEAQSETSWWSEFNPMKVFMSKWWPRHQECLSLSRRQNWISPIKADTEKLVCRKPTNDWFLMYSLDLKCILLEATNWPKHGEFLLLCCIRLRERNPSQLSTSMALEDQLKQIS